MKTKERSEWMKGLLYAEECNKNNKPISFSWFESADFRQGSLDYEWHLIRNKKKVGY